MKFLAIFAGLRLSYSQPNNHIVHNLCISCVQKTTVASYMNMKVIFIKRIGEKPDCLDRSTMLPMTHTVTGNQRAHRTRTISQDHCICHSLLYIVVLLNGDTFYTPRKCEGSTSLVITGRNLSSNSALIIRAIAYSE